MLSLLLTKAPLKSYRERNQRTVRRQAQKYNDTTRHQTGNCGAVAAVKSTLSTTGGKNCFQSQPRKQ